MLGRADDERPATYSWGEGFRGIWVLASSDAFTAPVPEQLGAPLSFPLGNSFAAFLESLVAQADRYAPQQTPSTIRTAEDVTAYIFRTLAVQGRVSANGRRSALLAQALLEIRRHAQDPATTPTTIARLLSFSLGHLHRIFHAHERTVAEEIRLQRTRLALTALRDPRLRAVDIETIARSSGFHSARTLRRALVELEGHAPTEIRRGAID